MINLKIKQKLLLSYFVLIIIPLCILTYVTYIMVSETVRNQMLHSAGQLQDEVKFELENRFEKVKYVMDVISMDKEINKILRRNTDNYPISDQMKDYYDLSDSLENIHNKSDNFSIKMYVRDGLVYSDERVKLFNVNSIVDSIWYTRLNSGNTNILWCPPSYLSETENSISAARIIWNHTSLTEKAGILKIDLPTDQIKNILCKANITKNGEVYIQNEEEILILYSDNPVIPGNILNTDIINRVNENSWSLQNVNSKKVYIQYQNLALTGWKLVSVIPSEDVLQSSNQLRDMMLFLMLLVGMIAYTLAYFISNAHIKRIDQILGKMKQVQKGNLNVSVLNCGNDEIGELAKNFNYMIDKINDLYEEQFKSGIAVKNAELKALQAQINPHFLYNSLDLINCIALNYKIPEINSMVQSLTKFYKLSLNKGRDLVSIKDEIEHVIVYTRIQNIRFDDKICLEINIPAELYSYQTLKIILQPLVENAIMHGIFEKEDKIGTIHITGFQESSETIIIRIQDDGVGMSEEKIKAMFLQDDSKSIHGYGVKNINDRIKLCFGDQYGLLFQSEPGKGTTVEIRFPAIKPQTSALE